MRTYNEQDDPVFQESWLASTEPGWEINQKIFAASERNRGQVLNCAIPMTQAQGLTEVNYPANWNAKKCLAASVGRKARPELAEWDYLPQIRAEAQLPYFKQLPEAALARSGKQKARHLGPLPIGWGEGGELIVNAKRRGFRATPLFN